LSSPNGAQGLNNSKVVKLLTIILFGAGVITAAMFVYQQTAINAEPFAVSKDDAIRLALTEVDKEPRRYPDYLPNDNATKEAKAELIHVTSNGLSFIVDEESLADMWLHTFEGTPLDAYENKYFWEVRVITSTEFGQRGYHYWVDADSGEVLKELKD